MTLSGRAVLADWRPVPGWEDLYEVSSSGLVRSLDRISMCHGGAYLRAGRLIKPQLQGRRRGDNYLHLLLYRNGAPKAARVHCLVAAAFIGPRPEGEVVRHLDGNSLNNSISNLAYGTLSQNYHDSLAHGRIRHGTALRSAKLTEGQVRAIRCDKRRTRFVAAEFHVSSSTVRKIRGGQSWVRLP